MQTFVFTAGQHRNKRNNVIQSKQQNNNPIIITIYLLLSGDIHQCPGPNTGDTTLNKDEKSSTPVSQVRGYHSESMVIEYTHQRNLLPHICCPGTKDGLVEVCRLGVGSVGAGERRPGALGAAGVGDGGAGDWDRPSLGTHGEGEAAVAMGKVFAFPHRISNPT